MLNSIHFATLIANNYLLILQNLFYSSKNAIHLQLANFYSFIGMTSLILISSLVSSLSVSFWPDRSSKMQDSQYRSSFMSVSKCAIIIGEG